MHGIMVSLAHGSDTWALLQKSVHVLNIVVVSLVQNRHMAGSKWLAIELTLWW